MQALNVLVVGAGAVGQVYGRHLTLGGAHVRYFVRPQYAAACRAGFDFYPLNRRPRRKSIVHHDVPAADVLTTLDEVGGVAWDQIYLCLPSHALRGADGTASEFLVALARAANQEATVVSLAPGPDDMARVDEAFGAGRSVAGMIMVISYQAPLPGEVVPTPGMAYWFPPTRAPLSGPTERTRAVADALRRGGLPCKVTRGVPQRVAFPSAVLMTFLTALEAADWDLRALRKSGRYAQVRAAAREAFAVVAAELGTRPPLAARVMARPLILRTFLRLARAFVPLDVVTYVRIHFTKVREQTRVHMRGYIAGGDARGLSTKALATLEASVGRP